MRAQLEQLLVLQDRDQAVRKWSRQLEAIPTEKAVLEARLAQAKEAFEKSKLALKENEKARHLLEIEEQTKRDAIAKYKAQMMQTRKNEEYQAFMHEIAQAEAAISGLEDRELALLEELDRLQPEAKAAEAAFTAQQEAIRESLAQLKQRETNLNQQIEKTLQERAGLAAGIESNRLDLYEALFKSKGDAAVVPLEHGVCGGCHMAVTLTVLHAVEAEKELVQCNNCGRILYRVI